MKPTETKSRSAKVWKYHDESWYVEEPWVSDALFKAIPFRGIIFDIACGRGNIVRSARANGLIASGFDIVKRWPEAVAPIDSLDRVLMKERIDEITAKISGLANIVTNPPFDRVEEFVAAGLDYLGPYAKMATVFPARRLNAAGKWLRKTPLTHVLYITPRPSMPPGELFEELEAAGKRPSGGQHDFAWLVWQQGAQFSPTLAWLHKTKGILRGRD